MALSLSWTKQSQIGAGQIDIRKVILDGFAFLLTQGYALPPLTFMEKRAATSDLALHLYFLEKVVALGASERGATAASGSRSGRLCIGPVVCASSGVFVCRAAV